MPSSTSFWEEKIVRDPLYGFIGLSSLEDEVLKTAALQRLSRIKQLAHSYTVYPSAVHTRLEHSLGTLYIAGRICEKLKLPDNEKQRTRVAALVHDIGHGPFSHLFEQVMSYVNGEDFSHEYVTKLFLENDTQLRSALGSFATEIVSLLEGDTLLSEIISSSLDADKMDYLRRDSYHTGVAYGIFDLERIVRSVCEVRESGESYLAIDYKAKDAIEGYRLARYSMHTQVYEHHARLIADDMFVRAVAIAIDNGWISSDFFDIKRPSVFIPNYLLLDDASIEHLLMEKAQGAAKDLVNDIRQRKLLKRAFMAPLTKDGVPNPLKRERIIEMTREEIANIENKIALKSGTDPAFIIVHLQSIAIKLYERFEEVIGMKDKPILIRNGDGSISSLDEESPISASMVPIRRLFVFCPDPKRTQVKEAAQELFEVRSVYQPG